MHSSFHIMLHVHDRDMVHMYNAMYCVYYSARLHRLCCTLTDMHMTCAHTWLLFFRAVHSTRNSSAVLLTDPTKISHWLHDDNVGEKVSPELREGGVCDGPHWVSGCNLEIQLPQGVFGCGRGKKLNICILVTGNASRQQHGICTSPSCVHVREHVHAIALTFSLCLACSLSRTHALYFSLSLHTHTHTLFYLKLSSTLWVLQLTWLIYWWARTCTLGAPYWAAYLANLLVG